MNARNIHFQEAMEQATGQKFTQEYDLEDESKLSPYGANLALKRGEENPPHKKTHAVVQGTLHGMYWGGDANDMYSAENEARKTNKSLGKTVSLMEAKGIAAEVIFHPSMDTIPHIDVLRKIYNPSVQIHQTFPADRYQGKYDSYYLKGNMNMDTGDIYLKPTVRSSNHTLTPLTVTHEVSHLLATPWMYGVHSNALGGTVKINPGHHWIMAKIHTMAVEAALGTKAAEQVKKEYRNAGIDFGEKGTEVDPWDHIPKMEQ